MKMNADDDNNKSFSVSGERKNGGLESVSARKLAAGLWQAAAEICFHGGGDRWRFGFLDRIGFELHSLLPLPNSAIEGATKWDPNCSRLSREAHHFHSHVKLCKSQQIPTVSVVSALQVELLKARRRLRELEIEKKQTKRKLKHFVKKLNEERVLWMRREHQKMRKVIDELKGELRRERRNRREMDKLNSKLFSDLASAKVSSRQYMLDYEKEKKAREILEKVCADLASEVEEGRAEIESLKNECDKVRDEVEEERKMLQMAEVWREERVQMKLVDAKLILEEKYSEINDLISGLDAFLKSRIANADMIDIGEAKMIKQAVIDTLENHDTWNISCVSPQSNDKYAVTESPQTSRAKELGIDYCLSNSPLNSKNYLDNNDSCKDVSGIETVTQVDDHLSNHTSAASEQSVSRVFQNRKCKQKTDLDSSDIETSEISSVQPKVLKKKSTTLRTLWSSSPNHDHECKAVSQDENKSLSNGSSQNTDATSLEKVSAEATKTEHGLVNLSCSPVLGNHHVARAMRGCIEWPRGIPRQGLKAKLLEARLESQKSHLRNILKLKS